MSSAGWNRCRSSGMISMAGRSFSRNLLPGGSGGLLPDASQVCRFKTPPALDGVSVAENVETVDFVGASAAG